MGRKRQWMEEDDSSETSGDSDDERLSVNDNDPDAREERALFSDPYKRKKQRRNGKEDAMLGVFAEDEGDEAPNYSGRKPKYSKPVTFVSKTSKDGAAPTEKSNQDQSIEEAESSSSSSRENEDEDDDPAAELRVSDQEAEVPPRPRGGLGAMKAASSMFQHFGAPHVRSSAAPSASKSPGAAADMPSHGGIGTSPRDAAIHAPPSGASTPASVTSFSLDDASLPTTFGSPAATSSTPRNRQQRSFVRNETAATAPNLSTEEKRHFDGLLNSSFGAKMMAKMGWQAGQGLGTENKGMVTPIEVKLRPKAAGIAYKGFKERTDQSKTEAKRRGEEVSDDEQRVPKKGKLKSQGDRSEIWKRAPRKSKAKVKHLTYEEILAEGDESPGPATYLGQIIDATGPTPREVTSLADVSTASWIPSQEAERLPEIRHNLRLLVSSAQSDLDGLAREARALEQRKKWVRDEDARLKKIVETETRTISRLQQIHHIMEAISIKSNQIATHYEATLDVFSADFDKLSLEYSSEYERYQLDEVVVGAIAPYVRRRLALWNPLEDSDTLTQEFKKWRRLLRISNTRDPGNTLIQRHDLPVESTNLNGSIRGSDMTPYESLMWNVWLPRLRSVINNDWSPTNPFPLIRVFEAWTELIPTFIFDNVMDQLVMPKLLKSVTEWSQVDGVPLHNLVLPWLPHLGLRVGGLLDDARRKLRSMLRSWSVRDGVPDGLTVWKDVLKAKEWDDLMLKYIVPKLGASLREDLTIDPSNQDMEPLYRTAPWVSVLQPKVYSQLLETEFFPKWLATLHLWLIQPTSDYDEVAQWYLFWKGSFSEAVLGLPGVNAGFTQGLQLMNKAAELKPEERRYLPKPSLDITPPLPSSSPRPSVPKGTSEPQEGEEIPFRIIVEEYVAEHNLLFVPLGKAHETTRLPMFRVSHSIDGRGGVTVYILDDVVWAIPPGGSEADRFKPVGLEDLVLRATKGKR